jgi:hypothetical protein
MGMVNIPDGDCGLHLLGDNREPLPFAEATPAADANDSFHPYERCLEFAAA